MKHLILFLLLTSVILAQNPEDVKYHYEGKFSFEERVQIAKSVKHYHYSSCQRCDMPWNYTEDHTTDYVFDNRKRGLFPLCVDCWKELKPEQRLVFYEKWFFNKKAEYSTDPRLKDRFSNDVWEVIKKAVLEGK